LTFKYVLTNDLQLSPNFGIQFKIPKANVSYKDLAGFQASDNVAVSMYDRANSVITFT